MLLSWLRTRRASHQRTAKRPASFRPALESLDERIVPANPHFIGSATSSVNDAGALVVDFKEAGLGNNQNIDYVVTGDAAVDCVSVNNGGKVVQGQPWTASDTTLATGTFSSDKNGNITATLISDAPSREELGIKTPKGNGWTQTCTVSYTDLVLTDTTNDVSIDLDDASGSF